MKNFPLTVSRYREDFREYEKENISNASYHNGIINIWYNIKSNPIFLKKW